MILCENKSCVITNDLLQMWAKQQLPSARVAISVWSSRHTGISRTHRSGSHSTQNTSSDTNSDTPKHANTKIKLTTYIFWTAGVLSVIRHQLLSIFTVWRSCLTHALIAHCHKTITQNFNIHSIQSDACTLCDLNVKQTTGFVRAAAVVVCQIDTDLSCPCADRLRDVTAVILHRHDAVVITLIHTAAVL